MKSLILTGLIVIAFLLVVLSRPTPEHAGWLAALRDPSEDVRILVLDRLLSGLRPDVDRALRVDGTVLARLFTDREQRPELVWRALALYDRVGFPNKSHLRLVQRELLSSSSWEVSRAARDALRNHAQGGDWPRDADGQQPARDCSLSAGGLDVATRLAEIGSLVAMGRVAACWQDLVDALRIEGDKTDPEGLVRVALLRSLAGLDARGQRPPIDRTLYAGVMLGMVDDPDLGLASIRESLAEAYWRSRSEMIVREVAEPLFERLNPACAPLVRAKAFEVLGRAPRAARGNLMARTEVRDFVTETLAGEGLEDDIVRAAVIRVLGSTGRLGRHLAAMERLLAARELDPRGIVRQEIVGMLAHSPSWHAGLPSFIEILGSDDGELFRGAYEAAWGVAELDLANLALLLDALYRRSERRAKILALAHVVSRGDTRKQSVIALLDIHRGTAGELIETEAGRKRAFDDLREIMLASPFERGTRGERVHRYSEDLRIALQNRLHELADTIDWSCFDQSMLATLDAEGTFDGRNGERLRDAVRREHRTLREDVLCRAMGAVGLSKGVDWFIGVVTFILIFLGVTIETIRRRLFGRKRSDAA